MMAQGRVRFLSLMVCALLTACSNQSTYLTSQYSPGLKTASCPDISGTYRNTSINSLKPDFFKLSLSDLFMQEAELAKRPTHLEIERIFKNEYDIHAWQGGERMSKVFFAKVGGDFKCDAGLVVLGEPKQEYQLQKMQDGTLAVQRKPKVVSKQSKAATTNWYRFTPTNF